MQRPINASGNSWRVTRFIVAVDYSYVLLIVDLSTQNKMYEYDIFFLCSINIRPRMVRLYPYGPVRTEISGGIKLVWIVKF